MDIYQLEAFLSIAKTKNFTKSAMQLYISQPTITGRIQSLEEWFGQPLFERNKRTVTLTTAGQAFYPYAEEIRSKILESKLVTQLDGKFQTRLVIGGAGSIWNYHLLPQLISFKKRHPEISFHLMTTVDDIVLSVIDGVLHIGIVYIPPHHRKISVLPLLEEELILAARRIPDHPISSILFHHDYIHMDWLSPFTEWFNDLVGTNYIPPLTVDHSGVMLKLLLDGAGFGFILKSVVEPFLKTGQLLRVPYVFPVMPPKRTAYVIFQRDKNHCLTTNLGLKLLNLQIDSGIDESVD